MSLIRCVLVVTLLLDARIAVAQLGKIRPVDEAVRIPSLVQFRSRLLQALARRDTAAVMAVVDPRVGLGFGGDMGDTSFLRRLRTVPEFWTDLEQALRNGGRLWADTVFLAPWWAADNRLPGGADAFDVYIITGAPVRARAEPARTARVLATLSYDVVPEDRSAGSVPEGWVALRLTGDRRAFVERRWARSPIDCRLMLRRGTGAWSIVGHFCGD